jgi:hypothetical protein
MVAAQGWHDEIIVALLVDRVGLFTMLGHLEDDLGGKQAQPLGENMHGQPASADGENKDDAYRQAGWGGFTHF